MVVIQKDPTLLCFSPEGTNDGPHLIHSFSTQYKEFLNEKHTEYREKKKKFSVTANTESLKFPRKDHIWSFFWKKDSDLVAAAWASVQPR